MGPAIILDKSTLQGLSGNAEAVFLRKYYRLSVPPILLDEILADLAKKNVKSTPEEEVLHLSRKLSQLDSAYCPYYVEILRAALLGDALPMNGTIPLYGQKVTDRDGNEFTVTNESKRETDMLRWQVGRYHQPEYAEAEAWRSSISEKMLQDMRNANKDLIPGLTAYATVDSLVGHIEELLNIPDSQSELFDLLGRWCRLDTGTMSKITTRWQQAGKPFVREFAPYAYFCLRVALTHHLGVLRGLFTTRAKDLFDLNYVFYLPFCDVFSSSDYFLINIVPSLLRADQVFISGADLKADLQKMVGCRDALEGEAQTRWLEIHSSQPPINSEAHRIRERLGWNSPREDQPAVGRITMTELTSPGAIWRKRRVPLDGPCFCGSGRTLRNCHYVRK